MSWQYTIKPGDKLYGFCNGYFGRDYYETKIVEAIGVDWLVVREENSGTPIMCNFDAMDTEQIVEYLKEWKSESQI